MDPGSRQVEVVSILHARIVRSKVLVENQLDKGIFYRLTGERNRHCAVLPTGNAFGRRVGP